MCQHYLWNILHLRHTQGFFSKWRIHLLRRRCIQIHRFLRRVLLFGVALLLLVGTLPPAVPVAEAANDQGPLLAAWKASELVGVSYLYGGENPEQGMDNSGLVYYTYQALGVDMPRTLAAQAGFGSVVKRSALTAGDLVFFNSPSSSRVSHVGIYLGDDVFVASSSTTNGVTRRDFSSSYYQEHFAGARRISSAKFLPLYQVLRQQAVDSIGIPYANGGSSSSGLDNVGLVKFLYGQVFLTVPDTLAELAESGIAISRGNLRAGDMVFFRGATLSKAYRVGMYIGEDQFVITDAGFGQVVQRDLDDSFYASRYIGARRPYANFVQPAGFSTPDAPAEPPVPAEPQPAPEPEPEPEPAPEPSVADQIIAEALPHLGKPYVLGANGPTAFDCSGFTKYVYARFGYRLPRASYSQATVGITVAFDQLQPGDLIFFKNTWRNDGRVDHVAIYMGDGKIVHAITSGVQVSSLRGYWVDHYSGARRVLP